MGRGRPALAPEERRQPFDVYLTAQERDLVIGALPRYLPRSHSEVVAEPHQVIRLALAAARGRLERAEPMADVRLRPRSQEAPRASEERLWLTQAEIGVATALKERFRLGTTNRGVVAAVALLADEAVQRLTAKGGPNYAAGLRSALLLVLGPDDPRRAPAYYGSIVPQAQLIDPWYQPARLTQPASRRFTV